MTTPVPSVQVALVTKPTEAPLWTDVTPYLESFSFRRGRQSPLEATGMGTGVVRLANEDRRFDPRHTTGPYYGFLKPMRRLRIGAVQDGRIADYADVVRSDGPVGYWRLGEPSGTTAEDSSGNGRDGTYVNTPTLGAVGALAGDIDTAVTLDGVNEYLTLPANAAFDTAAFSWELWFKQTSAAIDGLIRKTGASYPRLFTTSGTNVQFDGQPGEIGNLDAAITLNAWNHAVATFDGTSARLYVNGALLAGPTVAAYVNTVNAAYEIGTIGGGGANNFTGSIDEIAFYNTALSATRIAAHYAAGTTVRGTVTELFHGYVGGWPQSRESYGIQVVDLSCADAFKVFQLAEINAAFGVQRTDERLAAVLSAINWITGQGWVLGDATYGVLGTTTLLGPVGDRALDQGNSSVQAATLADGQALSHMQAVEQSECGFLFVGKDGALVFHNRQHRLLAGSGVSAGVFGDNLAAGSGELPYVSAKLEYDDRQIYNDVRVTRTGGAEQVAADSDSKLDYFTRSYSRSVLVPTDAEALSIATYYKNQYKDPLYRISDMVLDPEYDAGQVWPHFLGRELGDVITARATPLGGGSRVEQVSFIEGIGMDWDAQGNAWGGTWQLSQADTNAYWVLGSSLLGVSTALAF